MNAQTALRFLLSLISLLGAFSASAQASLTDREVASPRFNADEPFDEDNLTTEQRRDLMLRSLTAALELQPHQVVALRRVLTANLVLSSVAGSTLGADEAAVTPEQQFQALLSVAQLRQLRRWEQTSPVARQLNLIALGQ